MWDLPRPGIKPVSPALAGGLFYHWATREPHIPHLDFCMLLFVLLFVVVVCCACAHFLQIFNITETWYVSTPSECSRHWAEIICLHACLAPEPGCLWKAESRGLAHVCIFISSTWLHIHCTCTDRITSSHRRKYSKFLGRALWPPDFLEGPQDEKESSLSLSMLNSCHINSFLHWDIQIPHKRFATGPCEAPRRKRQCAFILIYLPQNLLVKWVFHGNTRETLFYTHSIQTESHSALGSTLRIEQGLWSFIKLTKASQLTFPAPTGPTTANSSPGLTVKERSCRVGVSDAYKLKFIKRYPF